MVFSSTVFLFIFLPLLWIVHSLVPQKFLWFRNFILCTASIVFYAYGEPLYILLMLGSVLINFIPAVFIGRDIAMGRQRPARVLTVITITADLLILAFFKYVPWLVSVLNDVTGLAIQAPAVRLPVGISFYTFQILSYVIDVSRGKTVPQRNYFNLLLYISFFPQLIAGPIVTYNDIEEQLTSRTVTLDGTALGIRRFIYGLSKKLLISNTAAVIADAAFASVPKTALAWLGAVAYCIQIYFDFSGYSDMAIGLASMFGFRICENFNYPYSAVSVRDFWKRWHISLTNWFREYVYIPLGGNRVSGFRTVLNRYIVFFLTGFWHGANFTYIVWGLWHGTLMMFERIVHMEKAEKNRFLRPVTVVYTLLAVCLGFVVFRADSLTTAFAYIGSMFSFTGGISEAVSYLDAYTVTMLAAGVVLSAPLLPALRKAVRSKTVFSACEYAVSAVLFAMCVMTLASTSFNPFIYYIF